MPQHVGIRGPGVVQRFQGDGILFNGTARGWGAERHHHDQLHVWDSDRVRPRPASASKVTWPCGTGTPAAACGGI